MKERTTETISIQAIDDVPGIDEIQQRPREKKLILNFTGTAARRETIGQQLKQALPGFLVGVHLHEPVISISKIITKEEVIAHQVFFEQCAHDYRNLATRLVLQTATDAGITFHPSSFEEQLYGMEKETGLVGDWSYYFHGEHCCFTNQLTGQELEVNMTFGNEFGALDPCFFTRFIDATPYQPLPIGIYDHYHDGVVIIDTMLTMGKFETIELWEGQPRGVRVVNKDRIVLP